MCAFVFSGCQLEFGFFSYICGMRNETRHIDNVKGLRGFNSLEFGDVVKKFRESMLLDTFLARV